MRNFKRLLFTLLIGLSWSGSLWSQEQVVIIPRPMEGSPRAYVDRDNLFAKSYHLFREGLAPAAIDSLKRLIAESGVQLDLRNYYVVVANFTDSATPIGLLHEDGEFFNTRLYGLQSAKLYYIYLSRQRRGASFVSTLLTAKDSPLTQALPQFIGLFLPFLSPGMSLNQTTPDTTWIDMREFEVPSQFQKFSNISILVKTALEAERILGSITLDNTSKERWSFGLATAVTSVNDLDFAIGDDGVIRIEPKPRGDIGHFAVINYNFQPVDTKARTLSTSFHLLGGMRLASTIEPLVGLGFGIPVAMFETHLFVGYSLEFAQQLKSGFVVGQFAKEDPFKLKLRGKPRFGIEVKFP